MRANSGKQTSLAPFSAASWINDSKCLRFAPVSQNSLCDDTTATTSVFVVVPEESSLALAVRDGKQTRTKENSVVDIVPGFMIVSCDLVLCHSLILGQSRDIVTRSVSFEVAQYVFLAGFRNPKRQRGGYGMLFFPRLRFGLLLSRVSRQNSDVQFGFGNRAVARRVAAQPPNESTPTFQNTSWQHSLGGFVAQHSGKQRDAAETIPTRTVGPDSPAGFENRWSSFLVPRLCLGTPWSLHIVCGLNERHGISVQSRPWTSSVPKGRWHVAVGDNPRESMHHSRAHHPSPRLCRGDGWW